MTSIFRYIPFSAALEMPTEVGTFHHVPDCWWLVHPEKGFAFYNWGGQGWHPLVSTERDNKRLQAWAPPYEVRQYSHVLLRLDKEKRYSYLHTGAYAGM